MKVAICDDDLLFLDTFSRQVRKVSGVSDVETYSSYEVFLGDLSENYDLVFMDIDWKTERNGIDVAARVQKEYAGAKIIFVTSYIDRFVEEVFLQKTNVQGILNKPVKQEVLETYARKIQKELAKEQEKILLVKENNRKIMIPFSDIVYLESHNHTVSIVTVRKEYYIYESLTDLSRRLPEEFCRCHRSYLVNMKYIQELKKTEIVLTDGTGISVGRNYRGDLEEKYLAYLKKRI